MFRNLKKERNLIDRELELYRKEKLFNIETEGSRLLIQIEKEMAQTQTKGQKQAHDYECTWHDNREKLNTELARLEEKKKALEPLLEERNKNYVQEHTAVCGRYEDQIKNLKDIIEKLVAKIPTEFTQSITNNK